MDLDLTSRGDAWSMHDRFERLAAGVDIIHDILICEHSRRLSGNIQAVGNIHGLLLLLRIGPRWD